MRFDLTIHGIGTTAFIELPRSVESAAAAGWKQVEGPAGRAGYESLALFCPKDDYTVCVFLDDTDYIAGLQVAVCIYLPIYLQLHMEQ